MSEREELLDIALSYASRIAYEERSCVGGRFCTVATTQYEKDDVIKICNKCWKDYFIELAKDELERRYEHIEG